MYSGCGGTLILEVMRTTKTDEIKGANSVQWEMEHGIKYYADHSRKMEKEMYQFVSWVPNGDHKRKDREKQLRLVLVGQGISSSGWQPWEGLTTHIRWSSKLVSSSLIHDQPGEKEKR